MAKKRTADWSGFKGGQLNRDKMRGSSVMESYLPKIKDPKKLQEEIERFNLSESSLKDLVEQIQLEQALEQQEAELKEQKLQEKLVSDEEQKLIYDTIGEKQYESFEQKEARLKELEKKTASYLMKDNFKTIEKDNNMVYKDMSKIEFSKDANLKDTWEGIKKSGYNTVAFFNNMFENTLNAVIFTPIATLIQKTSSHNFTDEEEKEYFKLKKEVESVKKMTYDFNLKKIKDDEKRVLLLEKSLKPIQNNEQNNSVGSFFERTKPKSFLEQVENNSSPFKNISSTNKKEIKEENWWAERRKIEHNQDLLDYIKDINEQRKEEYEIAKQMSDRPQEGLKGFISDVNAFGLGFRINRYEGLDVLRSLKQAALTKKNKEGEELSPLEKEFLYAMEEYQKVKEQNPSTDGIYGIGKGVRHSVDYIAELFGTKGVGRVIGGISKVLGTTNKAVIAGTELLATPLAQASTYNKALNNYSTNDVITDNKGNHSIYSSDNQKLEFVKELKRNIAVTSLEMDKLYSKPEEELTEQDKKNIDKLQKEFTTNVDLYNLFINEEGKLINPEKNILDSFLEGYSENLRENTAEYLGGKYIDKALGKVYNKVASNRLGNWVINSKAGKFVDKVNVKTNNLKRLVEDIPVGGKIYKNIFSNGGTNKMIHSLPAEVGEEMLVNLSPSYGKDYTSEYSQLGNPDFYSDVLTQTLILNGGFTTMGAVEHQKKMRFDKDYKEYYNKRKNQVQGLKDKFHLINNSVSDEDLAKHVAMASGGTFFDLKEYEEEIALLRNPKSPNPKGLTQEERNAQADHLEKNSFINSALLSIQTNTDSQYKQTLMRLSRNQKMSQETRDNALRGIETIDKFKSIIETNKDLDNAQEIVNLEFRKHLIENNKKDLEKKLNKDGKEIQKLVDSFNKENKTNISVDNLFENEIENEELDNAVEKFYNKFENNINLEQYLETKNLLENDLSFHEELVNIDLQYEKDPKNVLKIDKREKLKFQEVLKREIPWLDNINTIEHYEKLVEEKYKNDEEIKNNLTNLLKQKKSELEVNETLGVTPNTVVSTPQPIAEASEEQDKDTNDAINFILNNQNNVPQEVIDETKYFSRRRNDIPMDNKASELGNNIISKIENNLGRKANFDDFVQHFIKQSTYKQVEDIFNGLVDLYKATGRDAGNTQEVYNKYFNLENQAIDYINKYLLDQTSEQEVIETNKQIEHSVQIEEAKKGKYDLNGQPQTVDIDDANREDRRTLNSGLKAAFNFQDSIRLDDTTWQVVSRKLTTNDLIDNHYILDPSFVKPGMEFNVVQMDLDSIPMMEYTEDGSTLQTTWGLYKVKHNIQEGSDLWNMKVPMVAVYDNEGTPVPVFMIHEPSWYRESNISDREGIDKQKDIANEGFERVKKLRQQIANGQNKIVITDRNFGSLDKLNQHKNSTPISINEATGESTIGIVTLDTTGVKVISTSKTNNFDISSLKNDLSKTDSTGKELYPVGTVVDIRYANDIEGKPQYMVLPVMNNSPIAEGNLKANLDNKLLNNIKFGVLSALLIENKDNTIFRQAIETKYNLTLDKAQNIVSQIQKDSGINVVSNLADFVSLFVQVGTSNNTDTIESVINRNSTKKGITYFSNKATNKDNKVVSLPRNIKVYHNIDGQYNSKNEIEIGGLITNNKESLVLNNLEKLFGENGIFNKTQFNVNKNYFGKKDILITNISEKGEVINSKTYDEVIKDNLRTNIVSHQIKTIDGKSKWVLDIQPMIYFNSVESNSTGNTNSNESTLDRANRAAQEVVNSIDSIEAKKADIERRRQEELKERVVYDRFPTVEDGEFKIIGDPNNRIFRINETTGRPQVLDESNGLWSNTEESPNMFFETTKRSGFQKSKDKINAKYDAELKALEQGNNSNILDNLSQAEQEQLNYLLGSFDTDDTFSSRRKLSPQEEEVINNIGNTSITGLSNTQNRQLTSSLKNLVITSLDFNKSISKKDIKDKLKNAVEEHLQPLLETKKSLLNNLEKVIGSTIQGKNVDDIIDRLKTEITHLENIINEKHKLVSVTPNKLGSVTKEINSLFSTSFEEDMEDIEDDTDTFNDNQKDLKLSYSTELKLSLFGFEKQNKNKNVIKSFLGLNEYHSADDIDNKIKSVTTTIESNWDTLISNLKSLSETTGLPIYMQIVNKLNSFSEDLKLQLLHKTISKRNDLVKVNILPQPNEETLVQVLNENSTKQDLKWRNNIFQNFINSSFVTTDTNQDKVLNVTYAENKLKELKSILQNKNADNKTLKNLFRDLGLSFSDNTLNEYFKFEHLYSKYEILNLSKNKLEQLINKAETKTLDKESNTVKQVMTEQGNNLYSDSSKALSKLINLEIELNGSEVSSAIRVAGKTMQGIMSNTSIQDMVQEYKKTTESELFKTLKQDPYSKDNFELELLEIDEKFRNAFGISFVSPDSIKLQGKENFGQTEVDKIALKDNIILTFGLFTNTKGATSMSDSKFKKGLEFRIGQMVGTVLADKGRSVARTTALLKLDENSLQNTGNSFVINEALSEFLVQQLFESELNRIIESYNSKSPIKQYDKGAKLFTNLADFNYIEIEHEGKTHKIHELLSAPNFNNGSNYNLILNKLKEQAKLKIENYINSETDLKLNSIGRGEFKGLGFYNLIGNPKTNEIEEKIIGIDTNYVSNNPGKNKLEKLRFTIAEYTINNLLSLNSIHQIFLGDMAYYTKGSISSIEDMSNPKIIGQFYEAMAAQIDKRAASLIAPRLKLGNSQHPTYKNNSEYLHIAVNDVESISDTIKSLVKSKNNGVLTNEEEILFNSFEEVNEIIRKEENIDKLNFAKLRRENIINELKEIVPTELQAYLEIQGTDAQEYTTWQGHLDLLYRQGKLSPDKKALLDSAYTKLSNNEEVSPEELTYLMQPVKGVFTGLTSQNGKAVPVYIKSSMFPLLPQITRNLEIDEVRKKLESIEKSSGRVTRMSYQTANKIGSKATQLNMEDLYNSSIDDLKQNGKFKSAITILPFSNWGIQQETPSKEDKAYKEWKDSYIRMGSQMWKGIMGNGINKMGFVFPNLFSKDLLDKYNISIDKSGKLSGEQLDNINTQVYFEYSDLLKNNLKSELGLGNTNFYDLSKSRQKEIISNLQNIIKDEIVSRGYPLYLQDSVNLTEDIETEMPLMFDVNAHKFESLLQAVISNRLIVHKLPGNSHVSSSSEGFKFKKVSNLEQVNSNIKNGIVWIGERDNYKDLQATTITDKNGEEILTEAEVLIKSHYKLKVKTGVDENGVDTYEYKYVDLTSPKYSKELKDENGKTIGLQLIENKIPAELLSMFSYRIPTSSHQSGVILKVVGFLPKEASDLILVPKEHTTQLGEDYDIDKRYIYKSNYFVNPHNGNIEKLQYDENLKETIDNINSILNDPQDIKLSRLANALLQTDLLEEAEEIKAEIEAIGIKANKEGIINIGNRAISKIKIKMLENAMIDIYKSVYQSTSHEVQQKIFKPLVTEEADKVAKYMDMLLAGDKSYINFSVLSDNYQRKLLKLGADGKGGIGIHSIAVTSEAQFQRLPDDSKIRLVSYYDFKSGEPVYFEDSIGKINIDGYIGKSFKSIDGARDISDQHGENQNNSTDNINKGNMIKRNENSYTMSTYAFMAHMGIDLSLDIVDTGLQKIDPETKKKKIIKRKLHIPSLMLNQPIIRDYVMLKEKYSSITAEFKKDVDLEIIKELSIKYNFGIQLNQFGKFTETSFMNDVIYSTKSKEMTGQKLWDNLKFENANGELQGAVLQKFFTYSKKAEELGKYQQLLNMSTSKLGVSYFEVLQRINSLNDIANKNSFENISKLIGQYKSEIEYKNLSEQEQKEYTLIGDYYWKPDTIEGKMLINSVKMATEILPIFFPYENKNIYNTVDKIFTIMGKDINQKSKRTLKIKYDIMSSLNDFISTNVGIFEGSADNERLRLFSSLNGNIPLAAILNNLKVNNHPIMKNSLLKDMSFELDRNGTGISVITHQADHNTTFDKVSKYEAFNELLQSKEELGTFNGEVLTAQKLAQDLASYAFLADNENGATGFRNYITIDYLKTIGVTKKYREAFNNLKTEEQEGLLEIFIEQYFQHNPKMAQNINSGNINSLGFKGDKKIIENQTPEKMFSFQMTGFQGEILPKYVSIRSRALKNSNSPYVLYKYDVTTDSYNMIDVLGDKGFNEYSSEVYNKKSILNNKVKSLNSTLNKLKDLKPIIDNIQGQSYVKYLEKDSGEYRLSLNIEQYLPTRLGIDGILQKIYDSPNTSQEYKQFIRELQDYVKLDVNYVYGPVKSGTLGSFDKATNTITISSTIMEDALNLSEGSLKGALDIVKEVIFEEIIHSMTVNEFAKYVESEINGRVILKENAPLFATKLVALYEAAKQTVPYDENDISTYYSKDIYEFMAGMFVSPDYRAKLEEQEEGFMDRFKRILRDLFGMFYTNTSGKTLKYNDEIFGAINDLLKTEKQLNPENKGIVIEETKINIYAGSNENADLSNFAIRPFVIGGDEFQSPEQYFQYQKWNYLKEDITKEQFDEDAKIADAIMNTTNGATIKALGRKFKNLDVESWDRNASREIKKAMKASFEQNPKALARLLSTGNSELTHTQDKSKWGKEFPKLLMEIREELRIPPSFTEVVATDKVVVPEVEIERPQPVAESVDNKPENFTNHSGGAKGGDTYWDNIGREFGINNHIHYRPQDYNSLNIEEQNKLDEQYLETVRFLGRGLIVKSNFAGQLVRRDMMQANSADAIFGITELIAPGIKGRKGYINKKSYIIPEGGTGYATARGIISNKPTFIYNQSSNYGVEEGWYKWENGNFVKTSTPILTKNFAGIGSQEINEKGIQAIRDVYQKTFESEDKQINIGDMLSSGLWNENKDLLEANGMNEESFNQMYNEFGEDFIRDYIKKCKS